jgi:glycosyltransferase involved in cell wall biosynthesis
MKLVFLSDNMNFSGGRKLLFEYAVYLRSRGHDVNVLVQEKRGALSDMLEVTIVPDFSPDSIPECNLIVATTPREVRQAYESKKGEVIHFCQGFEITDLEQRLSGAVLPPRYQGNGILNKLKVAEKKRSWRKKLKRTDEVYRLPTHLVAVSRHLRDELEERYGRTVHLCENGIRRDIYHPPGNFSWQTFSRTTPLKIINIGPYKVTFKGIRTTIEAVRVLKSEGLPVHFIRVAPVILDEERNEPAVDEFYENIPSDKLAELLRSCHVYISNSTEGEGFGLPALEALSSGLIAVLSSISSYRNFAAGTGETGNFCYFVPEGDSTATAESVRKIISAPEEEICELRENALTVAKSFSFDKSCSEFEKILENISEGK